MRPEKEIRCDDAECNALNGKAVAGCLEVRYATKVKIRAPIDTRDTRGVLLKCRRCGREKIVKCEFFQV